MRNEAQRTQTPIVMLDLAGSNYGLILADPPWRYDWTRSTSRAIERHYPTMSLAEILQLPVSKIAAEDAVLALWVTAPKLPEGLAVMDGWDFTYRTSAVWDKEVIGMGHYFRGQHEHLLIGRRGRPGTPSTHSRPPSVLRARRGRHSQKPTEVNEVLRRMYPDVPAIELFARTRRPGWDAWGNEV
jgi:N6-adenosine-specific RNA methylase IME4